MAYTEVGRGVSNASGGSWANLVVTAGQSVRRLCGTRRLVQAFRRHTTDFCSVDATAFESILGVDPKPFQGGTFPVQPFVLT